MPFLFDDDAPRRANSFLVPRHICGLKISMAPAVKTVTGIERIRDGGSLAATFVDDHGATWILFLKIKQAHHADSIERLGFDDPWLIDADPAKRPVSTDGRIYSELAGPAHPISWAEAQALVTQIAALATALTEWAARALKQLQFVVQSQGQLPPDVTRFARKGRHPGGAGA